MDDWWADIDNEILSTLRDGGAMDAGEIARRLGVSEPAATSLILGLASQGKLRVRVVASHGGEREPRLVSAGALR